MMNALQGDLSAEEFCSFDDKTPTFEEENKSIDLTDYIFKESCQDEEPMDIEGNKTQTPTQILIKIRGMTKRKCTVRRIKRCLP